MKSVDEIVIDPRLKEELKDCFRNEDEVIIYSSNLVEISEPIYKLLRTNIKYRKLKVMKNKAMKLEGNVLKIVDRFIIEGQGIGQELEIYAKINSLKIIRPGEEG